MDILIDCEEGGNGMVKKLGFVSCMGFLMLRENGRTLGLRIANFRKAPEAISYLFFFFFGWRDRSPRLRW